MKKRLLSILLCLAMILPSLIGVSISKAAEDSVDNKVVFGDDNVRMQVVRELKRKNNLFDKSKVLPEETKPNYNPTKDDMLNLKKLSLRGITDGLNNSVEILNLSGIDSATNLEDLQVSGVNSKDLSAISRLTNLNKIYLSGLNLESLNIINNLKNLEEVSSYNNGLVSLQGVESLQNLKRLNVSDKNLEDISSVKGLNNIEVMYLDNNKIKDISSLKDLRSLKKLYIRENNIENIEALSKLINLTTVHLNNNKIKDIGPLSKLTKLEDLSIDKNEVQNIDSLSGLTQLKDLTLRENSIKDISALANLKKLTFLSVHKNSIKDISALKNLLNLEYLDVSFNKIENLSALSSLNKLEGIDFSNNLVKDIRPIKSLTNLNDLKGKDNNIEDVSSLQDCLIEQMELSDNNIIDFSSLKAQIDSETPRLFVAVNQKINKTIVANEVKENNETIEYKIANPMFSVGGERIGIDSSKRLSFNEEVFEINDLNSLFGTFREIKDFVNIYNETAEKLDKSNIKVTSNNEDLIITIPKDKIKNKIEISIPFASESISKEDPMELLVGCPVGGILNLSLITSEEENPGHDSGCGDGTCVFSDIIVKTKKTPIRAQINNEELKTEKLLNFSLFDSTNQEFVKEFKSINENGVQYLPELELIEGNKYILSLKDDVYHMKNLYIKQYEDNSIIKDFKNGEINYLTVFEKEGKNISYRHPIRIPAKYNGETIPNLKFKLVSDFETLELTSNQQGFVETDLIEDVTYMVIVESDKYAIESFPLVVKDKQPADGFYWETKIGKFPFDHTNCNQVVEFKLVDKGQEHKNDTTIVCSTGRTKVTGLNFKNLELNTNIFDTKKIDELANKDVQTLQLKVINPFRCEISKLALGNFKINRDMLTEKEVEHVYRVKPNNEIEELKFTQSKNIVSFDLDSIIVEKIAIVFKDDNIPEIKKEDIEKEVVKKGEDLDLTDNIKNLPKGSKVKDITEPKIDTNVAGEYKGKVEVTFPNGSKRIVEVPVVVEKVEETEPTTPTEPTEPEQKDNEIKNTDTFKEVFEKINSTRISGKNRQLTAVEVSKRLYKQADTVVLTSSSEMIDSLTSSPFGIAINAPTLFVEKDTILQEVLGEIKRLQPKKIIIAGGDSVISEKVQKQIEQMGVEVKRTAGKDRFQTAVKLGEQIRRNSNNKTDIILANGYNFIDALTAGSLAAKMNIPILLTGDSSLNSITEKAIKEWGIKNVILVGGDQQVSEGVISKLQKDGLSVERIAGKTRVETALKLAEKVNSNPEKVIFANGRTYADALIASYLSKKENAPIILIEKENVPVSVKEYLREKNIKDSIILGGDSSIANVK